MDGEMLKMKRTLWISSVGSPKVLKRTAVCWVEGQLAFSVFFPKFLFDQHLSLGEKSGPLLRNFYFCLGHCVRRPESFSVADVAGAGVWKDVVVLPVR